MKIFDILRNTMFPAALPNIAVKMSGLKWKRPEGDGMVDLDEDVLKFINQNMKCPYCHGKLFGGPQGGAAINLFCENVNNCDSRFNVVDPLWGFVPMGQFTGPTPPEFKNFIRENSHGGD
jgi:hypothetical protein